jgi:hypothetical protein
MKHIEDLFTEEGVNNLSKEDMWNIDHYDIQKYHKDFNNQIVSDRFAYNWVLMGI